MLKHIDKRLGKKLMAGVSAVLKQTGGAHVILIYPPEEPSVWIVRNSASAGLVQ
jgi:hypothetical protein